MEDIVSQWTPAQTGALSFVCVCVCVFVCACVVVYVSVCNFTTPSC